METELIVRESLNIVELFTGDKIDPLLKEITKKVRSFVPDLSTGKSRSEIASLSNQVRRSKTFLDNEAKALKERTLSTVQVTVEKIDSTRRHVKEELDALADEARLPLTEWEAEQKRIEEEKAALEKYLSDWTEAIAENQLFDRQREVERREAELAKQEADRLAKEEAERVEKDRIAREEQLKKEASDQARIAAEKKAEAEKNALIKKEIEAKLALEKAEREKKEAAERAEREKREALERAEREKQAAIEAEKRRAKEEADRKERERLEAERIVKEKAEKERLAAERKAKNIAHQKKINNESLADFVQNGIAEETAKEVIKLIAQGLISHITINY